MWRHSSHVCTSEQYLFSSLGMKRTSGKPVRKFSVVSVLSRERKPTSDCRYNIHCDGHLLQPTECWSTSHSIEGRSRVDRGYWSTLDHGCLQCTWSVMFRFPFIAATVDLSKHVIFSNEYSSNLLFWKFNTFSMSCPFTYYTTILNFRQWVMIIEVKPRVLVYNS